MAGQAETVGIKRHFLRSKRLALALPLSFASVVLFLVYQYDRDLYDRLSFWEVRVPVFVLVFGVCFTVLWLRGRRRMT